MQRYLAAVETLRNSPELTEWPFGHNLHEDRRVTDRRRRVLAFTWDTTPTAPGILLETFKARTNARVRWPAATRPEFDVERLNAPNRLTRHEIHAASSLVWRSLFNFSSFLASKTVVAKLYHRLPRHLALATAGEREVVRHMDGLSVAERYKLVDTVLAWAATAPLGNWHPAWVTPLPAGSSTVDIATMLARTGVTAGDNFWLEFRYTTAQLAPPRGTLAIPTVLDGVNECFYPAPADAKFKPGRMRSGLGMDLRAKPDAADLPLPEMIALDTRRLWRDGWAAAREPVLRSSSVGMDTICLMDAGTLCLADLRKRHLDALGRM